MSNTLDFEALFDNSPNPYMVLDCDFRFVAANDAYLRVTGGYKREEIIGRYIFDAFPGDPDDPEDVNVRKLQESFERVLRTASPDTLALIPYTIPRHTSEGVVFEERFWSATHTPILDERGEVELILQHTVDVTELQQLKQALREAEEARARVIPTEQIEEGVFRRAQVVQETNRTLDIERRHLRRLFEQAPGFIAVLRGPDHVFELANSAYYLVVGHRDIIGKPVAEALPEVVEQGFVDLLTRVYTTGEPFVGRGIPLFLQRQPNTGLEEVYVDFVYQPVIEANGSVSGIFVQGNDVTEQKRAQDRLRQYQDHLEELVRERTEALEESQAALQHAQRMEAVGKLTGGVAHDFNNLLQIISGNIQLLQQETASNTRMQRRLQAASDAVERGARLASQLLAFARRQPLEPKVINLGRLTRTLDELLRRALGEAIEIETITGEGLWNCLADPHELENVILNLAINSRDAMDEHGRLTIETANAMLDDHYAVLHSEVAPGPYVMLAISDTGVGMPPEVIERAFEPFFTTKPEGQGTGLGLSMVYGFVKQSGGHIKLYSEVGHGTTIKIYLPRAYEDEVAADVPTSGPVEGGTETILVVEDDEAVRATVVEMLTELGYRVLKASDAQSALAVIQSGIAVDLLFTDVVMPGPMRSPELAQQAKQLLPGLSVLFTSGYTENAIVHGGRLDPGVSLLSKPYRREELARKLRLLLDEKPSTTANVTPTLTESSAFASENQGSHLLRVLLVEDDEALRHLTEELVSDLGHDVVAASDAVEAFAALNQGEFDVLFSDVALPGMSGVALAREAVSRYPTLRVILASGYGRVAGTDEIPGALVLAKPYTLATVEDTLKKAANS